VHQAILADFPDLGGYQVYACGSASMVHAVHPAFTAHGLGPDDCFSDAFVPRAAPEMARLGGTA
jgi:CDP-4-dehydro-6-deoxyglucose reductase